MLVPFWKVRRELRATYDQAHALVIRMAFPLIRLRKRLFPPAESVPLKGQRTLGKRIVLYLVFPDSDDLSDRLDAMDYFLDREASLICVVNGKVASQWLEEFVRRCAYVLIRDNTGYDFGGYQRGVLFLRDLGHGFDHLHIINDSVLMPLVPNETIFSNIEAAAGTGFGGAVALPMDKPLANGSHPVQTTRLALSYWLYFSGAVTRSDCFVAYWSRYIATSSKVLTVRYGERGLSRHMAAHGYPAAALYTVESVSVLLSKLSPDTLVHILQYASFTDEVFATRCAQLLTAHEASPEWSEATRSFIQEVAQRRNFLHSFCYLAYEVLHVPFIKKTRIRLPHLMRQQYIAAVRAGRMVQPPEKMWDRLLAISS